MQATSVVFKHAIRVLHGHFLLRFSLLFISLLYANISAQSRVFWNLAKYFLTKT
nr:MAG TPA: hypothetical protein [Caudoviricetes sp.]